jgi:hypothetical protein
VWEWVGDWYEQVSLAGVDVQGLASGSRRVYRGGSWSSDPQYARVANRLFNPPDYRYINLGVRLLRTVT